MTPDPGTDEYRRRVNRMYCSKRWKTLRARVLRERPMCECPMCEGRKLEASVVDHIEPHRGDPALFYDPKNLQPLASRCHSSWKQRMEGGRTGRQKPTTTARGEPVDTSDPWYEVR